MILVHPFSALGEELIKEEKQVSELVGTWAFVGGEPGPTSVMIVTINEDGTYHWLDLSIDRGEDRKIYKPVDLHHLRHSSGVIDLKTGEEEISKAVPKLLAVSVTWKVFNGVLMWSMDMGEAGGQGLSFAPVGPGYIGERAHAEKEAEQAVPPKSDRAGG